MLLFLTWVGIVVIAITIYLLVMWFRHRSRARMRVQLTILFCLFAMIPVVPLTFLSAELFTRTADMLLLPGIGEAMDVSLQTLKTQAEEKGIRFFERNQAPSRWTESLLIQEQIEGCGLWQIQNGQLRQIRILKQDACPLSLQWHPARSMVSDVLAERRVSEFITIQTDQLMAVYRARPDSTVAMVCYRLPQSLVQAKNNIGQAVGVYQTLGMLKHSVIEKNLIWSVGVLLVLVLAGLSVAAARRISQNIYEPIELLVDGMQTVSDGRLDQPLDIRVKGEFRILLDAFNQMIHDLSASQKKLIQAERLAAWQDVARKVSHEIKNSLTPVSISLRRLRDHLSAVQNRKAVEESLEAIGEEMHYLQNLASHFSELAKMPPPDKQSVQVNDVIRSTLAILEPSRGTLSFQAMLAAELPALMADRNQIRQVLHNLLQNAMDASPARGTVSIQTSFDVPNKTICIEVRDEGHGIGEDQLEQVFKPYFTTKSKGTGLGLPIVQKIVQDHDGSIRAGMGSEKGMVFTVCLPIQ